MLIYSSNFVRFLSISLFVVFCFVLIYSSFYFDCFFKFILPLLIFLFYFGSHPYWAILRHSISPSIFRGSILGMFLNVFKETCGEYNFLIICITLYCWIDNSFGDIISSSGDPWKGISFCCVSLDNL